METIRNRMFGFGFEPECLGAGCDGYTKYFDHGGYAIITTAGSISMPESMDDKVVLGQYDGHGEPINGTHLLHGEKTLGELFDIFSIAMEI